MNPRPTIYDTVDRAVGEPEGFGYRPLGFAFSGTSTDFENVLVANLSSPTARTYRFSNVVSMRGPFKVFNAIVQWVVVYVANICKFAGIGDECDSYETVKKKSRHLSVLAKTDGKAWTLATSGSVLKWRQGDSLKLSISVVIRAVNAAYLAKARNLVKALVANDGQPSLNIVLDGHDVFSCLAVGRKHIMQPLSRA